MVKVKICGITNIDDALYAAACGADALGFVFYPGSPRYVAPDNAAEFIAALPPFITTVGLFVNASPAEVQATAARCGLDVVQLHGDEPPEDCRLGSLRVVKAFRVRDRDSLRDVPAYSVAAVLLDAYVAGSYGGTGHTFNWDLASELAQKMPVILAGGLQAENVAAAVRQVHPYAVDVSSGVEIEPGRKDPAKVKAFIQNAKHAAESSYVQIP